jgi:hypothetical protein
MGSTSLNLLDVNVFVIGAAFSVSLRYYTYIPTEYCYGEEFIVAIVYNNDLTGTHGDSKKYILEHLDEMTDNFINRFLNVREHVEAKCEE